MQSATTYAMTIRRMLVKRIDELQFSHASGGFHESPLHASRRLAKLNLDSYAGVRVKKDEAIITLGLKQEIKFYR